MIQGSVKKWRSFVFSLIRKQIIQNDTAKVKKYSAQKLVSVHRVPVQTESLA